MASEEANHHSLVAVPPAATDAVGQSLKRRLAGVPVEYRARLLALLTRPGRLLAGYSSMWVTLPLASAMIVRGDWRPAVTVAVAVELAAAALETLDDVEDGDLPSTDPILALGQPRLINASSGLLTLALLTLRGRSGRRLAQAILLAHAGQDADLALTGRPIDEATAQSIALQKTAQFVATIAWLGATAAGASSHLADQVAQIGHRLGLMGQWLNDLRAIRPTHSPADLLERKPTLLVAATATPLVASEMTITEARHQAIASGAASYVWLLAETQRQEALELLAKLEEANHMVGPLRQLLQD